MKKKMLFEEFEAQFDNSTLFLNEKANKDVPLEQWLKDYDAGKFDNPSVDTQIDAGWYDWFCKDSSLAAKTKKLAAKLKSILPSSKVDMQKHYVFFKNNCPMDGSLYDDFRICDRKSGNVIWTVTPKVGHRSANGAAEVWGAANKFEGPIVSGTWKDVVAFFKEGDKKPKLQAKPDAAQQPAEPNNGAAGKSTAPTSA